MKGGIKYLLLINVLLLFKNTTAQYPYDAKRDRIWLSGYNNSNTYDPRFGVTQVKYDDTGHAISVIDSFADFKETEAVACDTAGELLFSTNGIWVYDKTFQRMAGGDTLIHSYLAEQWVDFGYLNPQGILILPMPGSDSLYYIFHERLIDLPDSTGYYADQVYYTIVDISQNNGFGKITTLHEPIITNDRVDGGKITACRHANGRDWWVVFMNSLQTKYRRILFDPSGVHDFGWFNTGLLTIKYVGVGQAQFTPNGSKFVITNSINNVEGDYLDIYDFDRCSGELSAPHRSNPHDSGEVGLAISPDSKYVYTGAGNKVFQYCLDSANIQTSKQVVAVWDSFIDPEFALGQTNFYLMGNTPDGKIIINSSSSTHYYHVINSPDSSGLACNVGQHQIILNTFNAGSMANYPNFRLGPLVGSGCDTLTGLNEIVRDEKEKTIKVFPNPASTQITVDYGFTDWNKAQPDLEITNPLGQTVYHQTLPMYSGYQRIDVSNYPPGVYAAFIKRNGKIVAVEKFVVQ